MQDPNNPNTPNTNAFPIPPNDAPATFGGSTAPVPQAPVASPPVVEPQIPVTTPVVPVVPMQPEAQTVEPAPVIAATTPVASPTPVVPTTPVAEPVVETIVTPVVEQMPADSYTPPMMQAQAPPVQESVVAPIEQPQPVGQSEPVVPLSSNHFPEEPIMPEMPSASSVVTTPAQTQPMSQPIVQPTVMPIQPNSSPTVAAPVVNSILTPPPQPIVQPQPMQQMTQGVPASTAVAAFDAAKKKSALPKIALITAAILLVLSGILFAIMQFAGTSSTGTVGTKGEITWWGVTLNEADVAPMIEEYKGSHPDVKITYVKESKADYRERLTNALAKGTGAPDIFEMHNSWSPMFKNDLATIPSSIMTPDEFKGTFYPVIVTDMTTTKGIIGLPLYYDALTLYVNEDLFSVALKTAPKTWIDVQNLANPQTGITQKDKDGKIIQSAIALGTTDNVEYWPDILGLMMYQNKASFTNFESQQTKDTLAFYQYFGKTTGNWDSTLPKSTEAFAKGKTAMMIAPASAAYGIIQSAPTLHFKTYTLPQLPKENPGDPDTSYATYWSESVAAKSASKDAAWEFLKYASSGEALQKVNQNLKTNSKPQRAYPIPSLNQQFTNDPILGSIVALAPVAKSWYLADQTSDGKTGLNTQLSTAFASAFVDPKAAQTSVLKILSQYGISTK
jgi:ABC-type glycerol-3-phosphate transport system substrate-binding protein